ncbi:MAG: FAD-dependent oxidoreductase [Actinobacteria bacterium]|nr:FAD-dependent oxidoreductase [Actinomycetota bacterium]
MISKGIRLKDLSKIIIIGGVAAGTSAAVKARRKSEDIQITIYEKYKYISYGTCGLPYFVSGKITDIDNLIVNTVQQFEQRFNIKVNIMHEVINIDSKEKSILAKNLISGEQFKDYYDKLIIATGSTSIIINPELESAPNCFSLKTIDDALKLKEYLSFLTKNSKESLNAVIIGGGFIGLEILDAFLLKGLNITMVEKTGQILPAFDFEIIEYIENYLADKGIILRKEESIENFEKTADGKIISLKTSNGDKLACDVIFQSVGTKPDSKLAGNCGIVIGKSGAISVDEYLQTSDPDIYAAGDCCECKNFVTQIKQAYNLASIANIQGRCAGYNAAGGKDKFIDSIPTSIIKVLDIAIGKTGISLKEARYRGIDAAKIELHYRSRAGYYPGASLIHILVIYDRISGVILGFEAIGRESVDKKADVMSVAIRARMKIWDLVNLNLSYHPEYGSAKDSINILGMIGENIKKGEYRQMDVEELKDMINNKQDITIIDVRTKREFGIGHIEDALNIPVDELRDNLDKLDRSSKIVVHCRTSYRSYLAYLILKNSGFKNVWNLNGSYLSWIRKI